MLQKGRISSRSIINTVIAYSITGFILCLAYTQTIQANQETDFLANYRLVLTLVLIPIIIKFLIQLIAAPLSGVIDFFRDKPALGQEPSVSVLIPAWNEEVGIMHTLRSALAADYNNYEVIVINDGSTDKTHQLLSEFIAQFNPNNTIKLRYFALENGGKAKALNHALKHAKGEIVLTIDADSLMHPKAIQNIVKKFSSNKVAAVAGNVAIGNGHAGLGIIQQLEYLCGFFMKRADSVFNAVYIIGGAAAAYRRSVLIEAGGFDHSIITEDIEISTRILGMGYHCRYAPDAIIYTEGPSDLKSLCNQRLRWKYGRFQTFIKHRQLFFNSSKTNNYYLSWLLLPTALYAEFLLLLELPLLTLFFTYIIYTGDYITLSLCILLISALVSFQTSYDSQPRFHMRMLYYAPIAWLIWYVVDAIEFQALLRSLKRLKRKEGLQWQSWSRTGLANPSPTEPDKPML
ncbi:glycosyltransferase [Neptuniibacter sp. QD72_48]|uniref:glycosyltransferase n=1 Tax=unclassified Neptuniibacter TaxID=2630693 RepID=UPI0039F5A90A